MLSVLSDKHLFTTKMYYFNFIKIKKILNKCLSDNTDNIYNLKIF